MQTLRLGVGWGGILGCDMALGRRGVSRCFRGRLIILLWFLGQVSSIRCSRRHRWVLSSVWVGIPRALRASFANIAGCRKATAFFAMLSTHTAGFGATGSVATSSSVIRVRRGARGLGGGARTAWIIGGRTGTAVVTGLARFTAPAPGSRRLAFSSPVAFLAHALFVSKHSPWVTPLGLVWRCG